MRLQRKSSIEFCGCSWHVVARESTAHQSSLAFSCSNEVDKDLNNFQRCLQAIQENSKDAHIFCLIHKMDLIQVSLLFFQSCERVHSLFILSLSTKLFESCFFFDLQKEDVRQQIFEERAQILTSMADQMQITCFGTSIWDETLYKVRSIALSPRLLLSALAWRFLLQVLLSCGECICISFCIGRHGARLCTRLCPTWNASSRTSPNSADLLTRTRSSCSKWRHSSSFPLQKTPT